MINFLVYKVFYPAGLSLFIVYEQWHSYVDCVETQPEFSKFQLDILKPIGPPLSAKDVKVVTGYVSNLPRKAIARLFE